MATADHGRAHYTYAIVGAVASLCFFGVSACERLDRSAQNAVSQAQQRLQKVIDTIIFAGCTEVAVGPICKLESKTQLSVWLDHSHDIRVAVSNPRTPTPIVPTSVGGGLLYQLDILPTDGVLAVQLKLQKETLHWELPVQPVVPVHHSIAHADQLKRKRRWAEARERLKSHAETLSPRDVAKATSLLGRILLAEGTYAQAVSQFQAAVEMHQTLGNVSDAIKDLLVISYIGLRWTNKWSQVRWGLNRAKRLAHRTFPTGKADIAYYEGLFERKRGDLRTALRHLSEVNTYSKRLGATIKPTKLGRIGRAAREMQATTLCTLGRTDEGIEQLLRLQKQFTLEANSCINARLLTNIGWCSLLAQDANQATSSSAMTQLKQAEEIYVEACPDKGKLYNVELNIAFAAVLQNQPAVAETYLTKVTKKQTTSNHDSWLILWTMDLKGRVALLKRSPREALRTYEILDALASAADNIGARWRAAIGMGRAYQQIGDYEQAIRAYQRAETLADADSLRIPLGQGRGTFLVGRERGAKQLVSLLIQQGNPSAAFTAARRSRSRIFASLERQHRLSHLPEAKRLAWDQALARFRQARKALDSESRDDWKLPLTRLQTVFAKRTAKKQRLRIAIDEAMALLGSPNRWTPPPLSIADDEIVILYHPGPKGWVGFAIDASSTHVKQLGALPNDVSPQVEDSPQRLATVLIAPFAKQIESARVIRILAPAHLESIDFHVLPFRDRPLGIDRRVVYSLDLTTNDQSSSKMRRIAVVADPRGDLAMARREAQSVKESAVGGGSTLQMYVGDVATGEVVRKALTEVSLFHYAGHGKFAGADGLDSTLPLAGGSELTVGDVLALEQVPEYVVLSGCETARSTTAEAQGLGLAQSFVISGSSAVIAATRPVTDQLAHALTQSLYSTNTGDLKRAFHRAQRKLFAEHASQDWAAFRILIP